MKKFTLLSGVFCALFMLGGCSTEIEENEHGWTFCSCNEVQSDLKGEIATERDDTKRKDLELELEITVEQCGDFLLKEGATPEEFKEHNRKRADKMC